MHAKENCNSYYFSFISFHALASSLKIKMPCKNSGNNLRKEIAETEKALNETRKTAKVNIGQLSLINKKMDLQGNVIDNINGEIKNLNNNIYLSQLEINKMSRILDTLKTGICQ